VALADREEIVPRERERAGYQNLLGLNSAKRARWN